MAVALLKYDLTDSDDRMEFLRATKSLDMAMALWEIIYNTKKGIQRQIEESESNIDVKEEMLYQVFSTIMEIIKDHDINIDSLIE